MESYEEWTGPVQAWDDVEDDSFHASDYSTMADDIDDNHDNDYEGNDDTVPDLLVQVESSRGTDFSRRGKKRRRQHDKLQKRSKDLLDWILKSTLDSISKPSSILSKSANPQEFLSKEEYFASISRVCFEEAKASLAKGLNCVESTLKLRFIAVHPPSKKNKCETRVLVEFSYTGDRTYSRPGWAFLLYPAGRVEQCVFAIVAQGHQALSIANNGMIPIWLDLAKFYETYNLPIDGNLSSIISFMQSDVCEWRADCLSNLTSQQRMSAACARLPSPPFIRDLLGMKRSKHIKFDSDDDNEGKYGSHFANEPKKQTDCSNDDFSRKLSFSEANLVSSLNASQKIALRACWAGICPSSSFLSRVTLVQGPPGTGKTHFLVSTIHFLLSQGKKILVCAPSNKALTVIVEKYLQSRSPDSFFLATLIGVEDKLDSVSSQDNQIRAEDRGKESPVDAKVYPSSLISSELSSAVDSIVRPSHPMEIFVYTIGARLKFAFDIFHRELILNIDSLSNSECRKKRMKRQMYRLSSFMKSFKTEFDRLMSTLSFLSPKLYKTIISKVQEFDIKVNELLVFFDTGGLECLEIDDAEILQQILAVIKSCSFQFNNLVDIDDESFLPNDIVNSSQLIFSTLVSSGHSLLKKSGLFSVDALIIDEAAQALEAEIAIPIAYANPTSMILIGDPNQLPATLISLEAQRFGFGVSTMQRLFEAGHEYHFLDTQYRMHPQIMQYPNKAFYEGRLMNSELVLKRQFQVVCEHRVLESYCFLNIDGCESVSGRINPSISNIPEARAIVRYFFYSPYLVYNIRLSGTKIVSHLTVL
jgi:hypothetical protein